METYQGQITEPFPSNQMAWLTGNTFENFLFRSRATISVFVEHVITIVNL